MGERGDGSRGACGALGFARLSLKSTPTCAPLLKHHGWGLILLAEHGPRGGPALDKGALPRRGPTASCCSCPCRRRPWGPRLPAHSLTPPPTVARDLQVVINEAGSRDRAAAARSWSKTGSGRRGSRGSRICLPFSRAPAGRKRTALSPVLHRRGIANLMEMAKAGQGGSLAGGRPSNGPSHEIKGALARYSLGSAPGGCGAESEGRDGRLPAPPPPLLPHAWVQHISRSAPVREKNAPHDRHGDALLRRSSGTREERKE